MPLNKQLLLETLATVKANIEFWNQSTFHTELDVVTEEGHCGTSHCFAGFCNYLYLKIPVVTVNHNVAGKFLEIVKEVEKDYVRNNNLILKASSNFWHDSSLVAQHLLGLTTRQANILFDSDNEIEDLERIVNKLVENPKWNK